MAAGLEGAGSPLTVLVAPDSFKGSLSSVEVARALAAGWARARPDDLVRLSPLSDGGEGTLEAVLAAGGWQVERTEVHGPLLDPVEARWLRSDDGGTALVELAEASGLSRLAPDERAPHLAVTSGTGELIRAVLDSGVQRIVLGIGGSATTDGGSGILQALGARLLREDGEPAVAAPSPAVPALLGSVASVDLSRLDPRLADVELRIACDVTNPLLGDRGAAATYGPQKGATPDDVAFLDDALESWADALEAATGRSERNTPGAGAAGGTGFGLLAVGDRFRSIELVPGIDVVMELTAFTSALEAADLVITGEGRVDEQTAYGKTALGVAKRAAAARTPCLVFGGGVTPEGAAALADVRAIAIPVVESPQSIEEAMSAGPGPLERAAARVARVLSVGASAGREHSARQQLT